MLLDIVDVSGCGQVYKASNNPDESQGIVLPDDDDEADD